MHKRHKELGSNILSKILVIKTIIINIFDKAQENLILDHREREFIII